MTYVALANSFCEYSGRPHPLDTPYPGPSVVAASVLATSGQAASVAAVTPMTVDDLIEQVKQETVETTVEPGVVSDVNLANVVYDIKTEVVMPTPAYDNDVEECAKSEGESDESIDKVPITAEQSSPGADVESSPIVASEASSPEQRGDPLAEMAWPPRVLES